MCKWELRSQCRSYFKKNPNTVFLLLTPEHGNLGDHAIASAETELLTGLGVNYIEITGQKLNEMMWQNRLDLLNGFPILINGGGNLGTLWMDVEILERTIIQKNPRSRILILPNTAYYEDTDKGREELRKSIQIYNRHKHLTIFAREQISYDFLKSSFRNVRLVPDMVLLLNKNGYCGERKGCLLCLRSDCEKTRTIQQDEMIRKQAELLFHNQVSETDMIVQGGVSVADRESALKAKYTQFSGAELVITDRLHGMIFCAITGTPCIVVNSKSPKVRGCYEWIKHLDYIRFAERAEDIAEEYRKIPEGLHSYNNSHLMHYYETLAKDIRDLWR